MLLEVKRKLNNTLLCYINKDVTAVTIKPLYKAAMMFLDFPNLTKNVPIIEVNIQAPPIDKG